jgi:phosphatidylinositol alpha-1,6-mannosyltransferase
MERLNKHIADELASFFSLTVVGPEGCSQHLSPQIEVRQVAVRPLARFLMLSAIHACWRAIRGRPDIAFAGSGLTAPIAVIACWLSRGRSVAYLHGLDIIVDNRLYQMLWLPFLRRCDLCITNSRNTARLAQSAGIPAERISIIHPGVAKAVPGDGKAFRQRHGIEHARILLSVGRLTPRKGLLEFVRRALPDIVAACPDVVLLVIGDDANDALSGAAEGGSLQVRRAVAELGLERNVLLLGALPDEDLNAAYTAADLCIFPVLDKPGDVEGFGMVAVEAASYGLPTLAFDTGGVPDAVAQGISGWLVPSNNYAEFALKAVEFLDNGWSDADRLACQAFAAKFEWSVFGEQLRSQLLLLLKSGVSSCPGRGGSGCLP